MTILNALVHQARHALSFVIVAFAVSACQTAASSQPAVLTSDDAETIGALRNAIANALGVSLVEFGAGDPTREPFVSVLPPRPSTYETRSIAKPIIFDIIIGDNGCALVRQDTREIFDLSRRYCKPH